MPRRMSRVPIRSEGPTAARGPPDAVNAVALTAGETVDILCPCTSCGLTRGEPIRAPGALTAHALLAAGDSATKAVSGACTHVYHPKAQERLESSA